MRPSPLIQTTAKIASKAETVNASQFRKPGHNGKNLELFHASSCLLLHTYAERMTGVLAPVLGFHLHSEQLAFFPPLHC